MGGKFRAQLGGVSTDQQCQSSRCLLMLRTVAFRFFLEWQILCADGILGAQDCAGFSGQSCTATVAGTDEAECTAADISGYATVRPTGWPGSQAVCEAAGGCTHDAGNSFYRNLRAFLVAPYGQDYRQDVVWSDDVSVRRACLMLLCRCRCCFSHLYGAAAGSWRARRLPPESASTTRPGSAMRHPTRRIVLPSCARSPRHLRWATSHSPSAAITSSGKSGA